MRRVLVVPHEAPHLARTGRDWQKLLEFCRLVSTPIVDKEAIYGPRSPGGERDRPRAWAVHGAPRAADGNAAGRQAGDHGRRHHGSIAGWIITAILVVMLPLITI